MGSLCDHTYTRLMISLSWKRFSVSLCVGGQKQKYTRNRARAVKVQTEGGRQAVAGASIVPQVCALLREEGRPLDREEGGKQDCMCVFWICAVL